MKWGYKMKRLSILFLVLFLLVLTSCDEINGVLDLMPKFDSSLPCVISGSYAYFESEEAEERGEYTQLYVFDSKEGKYTYTLSTEDGIKMETGSYSVQYTTFTVTECNGKISLFLDDGKKKCRDFYWSASALSGPEYLLLDDGRKYIYW